MNCSYSEWAFQRYLLEASVVEENHPPSSSSSLKTAGVDRFGRADRVFVIKDNEIPAKSDPPCDAPANYNVYQEFKRAGLMSHAPQSLLLGTIRSLPINPSPLYSQGVTQPKSGLVNGGLNQGGSGLPLIGIDQPRESFGSQLQTPDLFQFLPEPLSSDEGLNQGGSGLPLKCSGIDQATQSLGSQLQAPFVQTPNQFQLLQQRGQFLQALARGSSIQASSPKVRVDSQDQEELTMEASTKRSLPINPSSRYSQGVTQPKSGLVNGGGSSFDDINGIESLEVRSKCKEKLRSNTSSPVDNDFDHSDEMGSDEINLIGSQTPKVTSKRKKKCKSLVWKFYKRITEKDGKKRAQCITCGVKYLIDSKTIGTSTLNRHIKKCPRNETHDVGQLEPKDQGPEPIQEENITEVRTPWSRWTTLSSPASGVLGTTPAVTRKRRRLAEMHTESDKSIRSKTAFRPTSHDSANKSAATEADEGKSSTPTATEEVEAPRDPQPSLVTTKSEPQEESGSAHKQFASAEESRYIGEQKKALKIMLNSILDILSKGQIECLGSCKIAVDVVLRADWSAVDVKPLEAIFTELFASSKEWQSIAVQDPALLYQHEVLDRVAILRRELNEVRELDKTQTQATDELNYCRSLIYDLRQTLAELEKRQEDLEIILTEATKRPKGIQGGAASKLDRLQAFVSMVEGILGVRLESADPEVAAQRYAAHKREAMKAQLRDFSGKINDFFKE